MSRDAGSQPRTAATVDFVKDGEAVLLTIHGLVDELFPGFGQVGAVKSLVIDVSDITRMTSFGVRQWLNAMEGLSKSIDIYLLGCPTFFVDQLNMVLNFGGTGKVLTVAAPYACTQCGAETSEIIDVLANRSTLAREPPERQCPKCRGNLQFDEMPESYFAFATKYGATNTHPAALQLLARRGLYTSTETPSEKPPRIIKLVHGSVTYFRIIGTIGALFRARPFLVGAEGEVVIDLAEVERFEPSGQKEWRRLIKSLAGQVSSITLADVSQSFLETAGDTLSMARHIAVASMIAPYSCADCGRTSLESQSLATMTWPPEFEARVCTTCGGTRRAAMPESALAPLQKASTTPPPASLKMFTRRDEILSRALTDANIASSGGGTTSIDDVVLGKYKIIRQLSAGGMAEVFLAMQVGAGGFEKPVAIKRIQNKVLESRQQAIELFLNEAKIAGRLTHPNIVQVLDVGEDAGALYLAMEYVHGKDLREVIKMLQSRNEVVPFAEALYIARETARALHYAFWSTDVTGKRLAVVHRDVSPHNVILGYDGTVKLLDFGVAMSSITDSAESLIVGKWSYMAPETPLHGRTDHRSDLFSLGVILYLLCSGSSPFSASEPKEIIKKIRSGDYRRLGDLVPGLPERLTILVTRLLSPNPDDRPQQAAEVVNELSEIMRTNSVESSPQAIADLLAGVFPPMVPPTAGLKEIVRQYPEGEAPQTIRFDRLPNSITPSARTSRKSIGISESFKRNTIQTPMPHHSVAIVPPTKRITAPRSRVIPAQRQSNTMINLLIAFAILGLISVVAYLMLASY